MVKAINQKSYKGHLSFSSIIKICYLLTLLLFHCCTLKQKNWENITLFFWAKSYPIVIFLTWIVENENLKANYLLKINTPSELNVEFIGNITLQWPSLLVFLFQENPKKLRSLYIFLFFFFQKSVLRRKSSTVSWLVKRLITVEYISGLWRVKPDMNLSENNLSNAWMGFGAQNIQFAHVSLKEINVTPLPLF